MPKGCSGNFGRMADTYTVTRSTSINASASAIYARILDFHEWRAWSPWDEVDPHMEQNYAGPDAGVGAVYTWAGNRQAGEGRMEITGVSESERIEVALDFLKPFKSSTTTTFELASDDGSTQVTWTLVGPATLMTKIMGIFKSMDSMVGPDFERGLAALKRVSEDS